MLSAHVILVVMLIIVVIEGRANYVQNRRIADKLGLEHPGVCSILMNGHPATTICGRFKPKSAVVIPLPTNLTSSAQNGAAPMESEMKSGFSSTDPLSHAREMDARKLRIGSSSTPAKKIENMMMETDKAQRKMRASLMRGG